MDIHFSEAALAIRALIHFLNHIVGFWDQLASNDDIIGANVAGCVLKNLVNMLV